MTNTAIFLDSTVQILRFIGSKDVKAKIRNRLSRYGISITSLVVRQEFKRRFLTDVRYVKTQLKANRFDVADTLRHINSKLSLPVNRRKLSISLDILASSAFEGTQIVDAGEKCYLLLSAWEANGLGLFDSSVGQVVQYSGCGCAKLSEIGPKFCTSAENCRIDDFITLRTENAQCLKQFLSGSHGAQKTNEILAAEAALERWLSSCGRPSDDNPCLSVGDLIISMESAGVPVFYTKNGRESQFFCKAQGQSMVILREEGEVHLDAADAVNWPAYS